MALLLGARTLLVAPGLTTHTPTQLAHGLRRFPGPFVIVTGIWPYY